MRSQGSVQTLEYTAKLQPLKQYGTGTKTDISINGTGQSLEINSSTFGQLLYDEGGKNIQGRKDNFFNKLCWERWKTASKE